MIYDDATIQTFSYFGESMRGVFRVGDLIYAKQATCNILQIGDIIAFRSGLSGKYIVHRIVAKRDQYIITQGDNNPQKDCEKILISSNPPMLVIKYNRNGKFHAIRHGRIGILIFRYHQLKLTTHRLLSIFAPLLKYSPLCLFAVFLPPLNKCRFGDKEFLYCGKRHIGEKLINSDKWHLKNSLFRLFFSEQYLSQIEKSDEKN